MASTSSTQRASQIRDGALEKAPLYPVRLGQRRTLDAEVVSRTARGAAASRSAVEEALINEIGLDHVFDGALVLAHGGGHCSEY